MKMMDSIIISGKYSSAILSSVQISLVLHSDNLYEQNSDTLYNPTLLVTNNEQIAQTKSNCFAFSFFLLIVRCETILQHIFTTQMTFAKLELLCCMDNKLQVHAAQRSLTLLLYAFCLLSMYALLWHRLDCIWYWPRNTLQEVSFNYHFEGRRVLSFQTFLSTVSEFSEPEMNRRMHLVMVLDILSPSVFRTTKYFTLLSHRQTDVTLPKSDHDGVNWAMENDLSVTSVCRCPSHGFLSIAIPVRLSKTMNWMYS